MKTHASRRRCFRGLVGCQLAILSGYVADDLALRGIAEGRYRQLPKPFGARALLRTLAELTAPAAGSGQAAPTSPVTDSA